MSSIWLNRNAIMNIKKLTNTLRSVTIKDPKCGIASKSHVKGLIYFLSWFNGVFLLTSRRTLFFWIDSPYCPLCDTQVWVHNTAPAPFFPRNTQKVCVAMTDNRSSFPTSSKVKDDSSVSFKWPLSIAWYQQTRHYIRPKSCILPGSLYYLGIT